MGSWPDWPCCARPATVGQGGAGPQPEEARDNTAGGGWQLFYSIGRVALFEGICCIEAGGVAGGELSPAARRHHLQ